MSILTMSRKDFLSLPQAKWDEKVICDSLVIISTRTKHNSGYGCMSFAAVLKGEAFKLISGISDVLCIEGLSTYLSNKSDAYWKIDCLPKSRLLHIWPGHYYHIKCGPALSSFEIFSIPKTKGE